MPRPLGLSRAVSSPDRAGNSSYAGSGTGGHGRKSIKKTDTGTGALIHNARLTGRSPGRDPGDPDRDIGNGDPASATGRGQRRELRAVGGQREATEE